MESFKRIKWSIEDNDLLGCLNDFVLCVSMKPYITEIDDSSDELPYDHVEMGFLLLIQDLNDGKRGYCTFSTLENALFYINNYLSQCRNITEANNLYRSFCTSQEVIEEKGYTS